MADLVIHPHCSICNKIQTNHFCNFMDGAVRCNKLVCSLCKVDVMGMQEYDPHHCQSHPLVSTLQRMLCCHCNKLMTANCR